MGDFHLNLCHELVEIMSDLDDLANEFIIKKRANYKMKFFESRQIQRTIYIVIRKKNTMQFHWRMNQQIIWSNFCRYFVSSQIRSGVCQTIDQSPLATVISVTLQLSIVCLQCFFTKYDESVIQNHSQNHFGSFPVQFVVWNITYFAWLEWLINTRRGLNDSP